MEWLSWEGMSGNGLVKQPPITVTAGASTERGCKMRSKCALVRTGLLGV